MDDKQAKKILHEHKEALDVLLGDNIKSKALKHAKGAELAKKTFLDRVKELPVVEKISSLGTAGTVAVGTAAATQADLAINYTEIVVAQVAEDVWEGVIEPPGFIDSFVDFDSLHVWGQGVIAEKVAEVSELQPTAQPSAESADPKPAPSSSSQGTPGDKPSQSKPTESSQESKEDKSEKGENKSSKDNEKGKDQGDKQEQPQEQKAEESKETQSSSKATQTSKPVNTFPKVETPYMPMNDDIKPHSSIRAVSPTN